MPHSRNRLTTSLIADAIHWSPIVGIYGLRQVGKTTLAQALTKKAGGMYASFDNDAERSAAQRMPHEYLSHAGLFCIDEAQRGPWIFPAMKDIVGTRRKPGQFLLTGSVRFTLKKEIQEALTGRILLYELLPFTVSEAHGLPPSTFIEKILEREKLERVHRPAEKRPSSRNILHHMTVGGLPIPCFTRHDTHRQKWYQDYFETLILRDVPLADASLPSITYSQGMGYLRHLAQAQGQEINVSQLARGAALSLPVAKKLLSALQALCLIDLIVPERQAHKSIRKMRIEWKDIGLWNYFNGTPSKMLTHDVSAMSVMLAQEFRAQISLMKKSVHWSFYKTPDGGYLPWIFRQGSATAAILYLPVENPTPYQYRSLKQFLAREPQGRGIILGSEKARTLPLDERIWLTPYTSVF